MNTSYSPEEVWSLRHEVMPIVLNIRPPEVDSAATIENAERFVGSYAAINRWGTGAPSARTVTAEAGKLIWDNPVTEAPGARLFQLNDSTFTWTPYPYDMFIFHKVGGKITAVSEYADGFFVNIRLKNDTVLERRNP